MYVLHHGRWRHSLQRPPLVEHLVRRRTALPERDKNDQCDRKFLPRVCSDIASKSLVTSTTKDAVPSVWKVLSVFCPFSLLSYLIVQDTAWMADAEYFHMQEEMREVERRSYF